MADLSGMVSVREGGRTGPQVFINNTEHLQMNIPLLVFIVRLPQPAYVVSHTFIDAKIITN